MTPIERLREAAAAAADLGLAKQARSAEVLADESERRLGFPGDVYVMALVGGTGVGKSSVLNALAGEEVSPARALRPTTEQPIAWVANEAQDEIRPLLDWLGVERVAGHDRPDLSGVAILDLPDVDSVRIEHRATVDALLPRVDAVAWVVDPEKYDDERIHTYLRRLAPHADRMRFIFNKADRLAADERKMLADDLRRQLAADGIPDARVDVVSAQDDIGIGELRTELAQAADAKAIVAARVATDAAARVEELARAAGLDPDRPHTPLLTPAERETAVTDAVQGATAVVDLDGVSRQMQEAVMHRAQRRGGSLLARVLSLLSLITGTKSRKADPGAYLVDWRRRGSLGHVLNPLRAALVKAVGLLPAQSRPSILENLVAEDVETAVARALDRSTRHAAGEMTVPSSMVWPVVGFIQLFLGAVLLFAVAWYLVVIFGPNQLPVATIDVPYLGPVPTPLVLLTGSLALSILLGFLLKLHAARIGRRIGREAAARVRESVAQAVTTAGFAGLERVEDARRRLATLTRGLRQQAIGRDLNTAPTEGETSWLDADPG
jgi:GTP-binding protein EngB required for normal cell division